MEKMDKNKKRTDKNRGMTLVGVLIGITILGVALAAQIRLLGNTIKREAELRNIIIATNLAREGIEIAFAWRVTNGWNDLKEKKEQGYDYCPDIITDMSMISCGSSNMLNYLGCPGNPEFKAYFYGNKPADYSYDAPSFWRIVRIKDCCANPGETCSDPISDDECLELVSTVGWDESDKDKNVKLTKKVYNWYVP